VNKQCKILKVNPSTAYYNSKADIGKDVQKILWIKEEYFKNPFYGYRKIARALKPKGLTVKQVRRIMKMIGLQAIFPKKNLSKPAKAHKKYPYLLKNKKIFLPNQVWATDITYISIGASKVYLVAIIDLFSRKILSWRISNTIDIHFCLAVLDEAIRKFGIPAIFNSDQGSQFTSPKFTDVLKSFKIRISMDGKGRALDNIYIERFWRSLKYENIYLNDYRTMEELKEGLEKYFTFYNTERFHQSLEYKTPEEIYYSVFKGETFEKVA
jgi:putative transposase